MELGTFKWFYVVGGILFSALAQICMKRASFFEVRHLFWYLYLVGSLFSYLFSFIAYYLVLKSFPISKISPLMTVGVVLLVVLYGIWMGETVGMRHAAGLLLGVVSIFLILS
jgi:drug/metabolite transporter (DMT)-like permease